MMKNCSPESTKWRDEDKDKVIGDLAKLAMQAQYTSNAIDNKDVPLDANKADLKDTFDTESIQY